MYRGQDLYKLSVWLSHLVQRHIESRCSARMLIELRKRRQYESLERDEAPRGMLPNRVSRRARA